MKKKLIDLRYIPNNPNDSYSLSLEQEFDVIYVIIPIFNPRLLVRESHIEEFSSFYVKILKRFKRYLVNEEMSLHLSILDEITSCIALAMQEEGWEVYAKSLKPEDLTFHTIKVSRDLLIDTYKVYFPFTKKEF
jgi:hypothetical protein